MLHLKKRKLIFIYSIFVGIFIVSITICYNPTIAYAERWEPCTDEYTIMDMLSEMFSSKDESGENSEEKSDELTNNNLQQMDTSSAIKRNLNSQIIPKTSSTE